MLIYIPTTKSTEFVNENGIMSLATVAEYADTDPLLLPPLNVIRVAADISNVPVFGPIAAPAIVVAAPPPENVRRTALPDVKRDLSITTRILNAPVPDDVDAGQFALLPESPAASEKAPNPIR